MKFVLTICLTFFLQSLFSQVDFLSCGANGELLKGSTSSCCVQFLGQYENYIDIAVTPDGTIYGLNGFIYKIDTSLQTSAIVSLPIDQYGTYSAGTGLVALNNDYLITNYGDSLFLIEINSGFASNLGKIGYGCNGDFAFYNGELYMSSSMNELIKIKLDPVTNEISDVQNIGVMSVTGDIYSLFTTYDGFDKKTKCLYSIEGNTLYKVNTLDASLQRICNFDSAHGSFGAASVYDFDNTDWDQKIPNVFTPNNDGINDHFIIPNNYNSTALTIFNRWGDIVYEWKVGEKKWNGTNQNDLPVSDGVYFYLLEILDCSNTQKIQGSLTLLK